MKIPQAFETLRGAARNLKENFKSVPPAQITTPSELFAKDGQVPERDWTVLVCIEGKDRLAESTDLALNKMEQIGSTGRAHVVVQASQEPLLVERTGLNMKDLPTRRYYIQQDAAPTAVNSPVLQELPAGTSLNAQSLADFLEWGVKTFPSKHIALILKKHGAGFAGSGTADNPELAKVPLPALEMSEALSTFEKSTGRKLDLLAFDSCSMQQMEVAYQLRNHAAVVTGSEEDVLAKTYPYGSILAGFNRLPEGAGAQEAGKMLVETFAARVPRGMQSALDTDSLSRVASSVSNFVDTAIESGVSKDLLYTTMLEAKPMDRSNVDVLGHSFKDVGSFLDRVRLDERYPTDVRRAATQARQACEDSVLRRSATEAIKVLKEPTGAAGFMPWKALDPSRKAEYSKLDWSKDSGWGKFLDYVLEREPSEAPEANTKSPSPLHDFSKWGLYQYKKYISSHLDTACPYTLSCSQFAREAIEQHGLWRGGIEGALRVFSCDGKHGGDDPVAHPTKIVAPVAENTTPGIYAPPQLTGSHKLHGRLAALAHVAGSVAGGVGLGLLAAPVGACAGAFLGWKAGRDTLEEEAGKVRQRYGAGPVHGFENITARLAEPAKIVRARIVERTGDRVGTAISAVAGAVLGAGTGLAGAGALGFKTGKQFGGIWAENRVKDHFGELPVDPQTQRILDQDYSKTPR